jgi:hypothetical protein
MVHDGTKVKLDIDRVVRGQIWGDNMAYFFLAIHWYALGVGGYISFLELKNFHRYKMWYGWLKFCCNL